MAQIHYYRDITGTLTDMSAYAPRLKWVAQSKAEEGAYGSWTVTLNDFNSDLVGDANVIGHRQWFVEDDESEDDDDIIFGGFIGAQTFARLDGDERSPGGSRVARVITLELIDANTWFSKIVMRGSDCKRPIETDVERMTWLLGTAEAAQIVDTTTYFNTAGPVNMDAADVTGTYFGQIVADCASASGKNYYLWYRKVAGIRTLTIWYGKDTLTTYVSPFYLTNDLELLGPDVVDPAVADDIFELSADAKMTRSPERQYCGNLVNYGSKGGRVYVHSAANHALIASYGAGHRDMVSYFPLVKTAAAAKARGVRQLADVHPQDIRITTRVFDLPATRVTELKAGMRIQIKATHWATSAVDVDTGTVVTPPGEVPDPPVGGGTPGTDSLQAAIDATPSGGTLDVTGQTFAESATIDHPMKLIGGTIDGSATRDVWLTVTADDVTLIGTTFTNAAAGADQSGGVDVSGANFTAEGCSGDGGPYAIFRIWTGATGARLTNCSATNGPTLGLIGWECDDLTVDGGRYHDNPDFNSGLVEGGGIKIGQATGVTVQNVEADNNLGPGIWLDVHCDGATISDNNAHDNDMAGIQYEIGDTATISGNTANRNGSAGANAYESTAGIMVSSSRNVTVSGNTSAFNADNGATGADIAFVSQNRSPLPHNGNSATGNVVRSAITAIQAYTDWADTGGSNTISGNTAVADSDSRISGLA